MSSGEVVSNAESFVGRYIYFSKTSTYPGKDALIVAYNPDMTEHTVEFKDGTETSLVLAMHQFEWLVEDCEPAERRQDLLKKAVQRDAVGRQVKVFNKPRAKWYFGTILSFNERTEQHTVKFDIGNGHYQEREFNLYKWRWKYTDLIASNSSCSSHQTMITSKYCGVRRSSIATWNAFTLGTKYIGAFRSEKDAALAHDFFARRKGLSMKYLNFPDEKITEQELRESKRPQFNPAPIGKCKFRGVHWQKNRKRWMARFTLAHQGKKNINLGAFVEARHAALAFDAEARKRGRTGKQLNFPDEQPSESQIDAWKSNTTHYTMMGSKKKVTSQYRGVSRSTNETSFHVQVNIRKVFEGMGKERGPFSVGKYVDEIEAALAFDRTCRRFGVPEKELNFPRNQQHQKEVRLFDDECYFCNKESPDDPVVTTCNHVYCRKCITTWLHRYRDCPCCHQALLRASDDLRPVKLIPWPKAEDPASEGGSSDKSDNHRNLPSALDQNDDDSEEADAECQQNDDVTAPKKIRSKRRRMN